MSGSWKKPHTYHPRVDFFHVPQDMQDLRRFRQTSYLHQVRVTLLLLLYVALLSSAQPSAQDACDVTQTTPIRVQNATGVVILRAALNCTDGGEVEADWAGIVPVDAPIVIAEGTFLFVAGEDDLAEVQGDGSLTNGTRLFEVSQGGGLTLTGLKLSGGSADGGGAIYSLSANVTLDNCIVEGNIATDGNGGGAIWADGGNVTIIGGEFFANDAGRYGGAVHVASTLLVVRGGSRFEGNTAVGGGAIYCGLREGGSDEVPAVCSITDAEFLSNSAAREDQGSVPDFSNLDGGGAVMLFLLPTAEIINSTFSGNHAKLSGGALHGGHDTNVLVHGCKFGNNTSGKYGGAIFASSMTLGGGTQLTNNEAEEDGGAVLGWDADGTIVFNDVICRDNSVKNKGGCFYGVGRGIINNATVMLNNVADRGGGIYADDGSDVSVRGGNFSGGSSTRGGFLFADSNTRVDITGGVIENNVATVKGGALYCDGDTKSNISIEGAIFKGNKALESGGAIALWGAPTLVTITGGIFENNGATQYGGFVLVEVDANLTCEGAIINRNYAGDQGGGIYASGATSVNCSCDLTANESPQGAAVYLTNVKSATFESHDVTNNLALGGSVMYLSESSVVARGVTFKSTAGLEEYSIDRAVQMDGSTTLHAERCVFAGWPDDTIIVNTNPAIGSLVLDSCDFSRSSATMPVKSSNSDAKIRNAVVSSHTFDNAITGTLNTSLMLVDRALNCSDSKVCGAGECLNSTLGVLCECLEDGDCLDGGGELFLGLKMPPAEETFSPDSVTFMLVVSAGNGTTYAIWDLRFEADDLALDIFPSEGVLPPGSNVTVAVTGTPSKQDVGGQLTMAFTLTSVGSGRPVSTTNASREVTAVFYLCPANQYAIPQSNDASGVLCEDCADIGGGEGADCKSPGATLASLPIRPGYWRPSKESSVVFECLQPNACRGATKVSGPDDYCDAGYMGPYCAVCMDAYGRGVSNTCHYCDDTTVHVHIAIGTLFSIVVILLLFVAVVYLIGGLDAIDIIRHRKRSVQRKAPNVRETNVREQCVGIDSFDTPIAPADPWAPADNGCGGEGGTECSRALSNSCPVPGDFDQALAGPFRDGFEAGVEVLDVANRHDPRDEGAPAPRAVGHSAVTGVAVGRPQGIREQVESTDGGMSKCSGFGDTVQRWVSRLPLDKFKILVVVWQIISAFSSITGVEFPASYSRFLSWISVVNLDIGDLVSVSCVLPVLNFYVRLLVSTLAPLLLMSVLVLTYHMAKRRAGLGRAGVVAKRDAWSRHMAAGLLLTFLVFTSVSTVVFKIFACDDGVVDGESYLRVDYSISCKSNLYTFFQVYAGLMILVYPIGIPVLYARILWTNRELLNPRVATGPDGADESGMGTDSDRRDGKCSSLLGTTQIGQTTRDRPPQNLQELEELVKARGDNPELAPSTFLWKDFDPEFYYYEVIECGRRMVLTGVLIFIAPGTASQAAMACILAFGSIMGFELMRPHTDPTNVWLYRLGCVIIFLSNFLALLIKVDVGETGNRAMFGGILIAVNVLLVVAVVTSSWFTMQQSVDDTRGEESP